MLEVKGAIDLNYFFATGKAKELDPNSSEIVDIMSYPNNYNFDPPSITDVINNIHGIGKCTFESYKATPEETNIRIFIKREFNLTMGQAALFSNEVLKLIRGM